MPTHTAKGKNKNDGNPTTLAVTVVSMEANRLYTVWIESSAAAGDLSTPTVTSPNLTWVQVGSNVTISSTSRLSCHRAMPGSVLSNEQITATWGIAQTGATMIVVESDGVATGSNGANAIGNTQTANGSSQQSGSNSTTQSDNSNDTMAAFLRIANEAASPGLGGVEIDEDFHTNPNRGLIVLYDTDPQVQATWTSAVNWGSLAIEISAVAVGGGEDYTFSSSTGGLEVCGICVLAFIEGDQPEPPQQEVPPAAVFVPVSAIAVPSATLWECYLLNTTTMERLAAISGSHTGRNRSLDLILNRPGSAKVTVLLNSEEAMEINPITTALEFVRAGQTVWSGPVWTMSENAAANTLDVSAVGWLQLLNHRLLRVAMSRTVYDSSQFARDLINTANGIWQTGITVGGMEGGQMITRRYEAWTRVLDALLDLSNVENGFDLEVDPVTKALNIWVKRGVEKPNAHFGFGKEPRNVENVVRTTDAGQTANWVSTVGKLGSAYAEDVDSQVTYGLFEDRISLSDVSNNDILLAYAGVELALRLSPRTVVEFIPMPTDWDAMEVEVGRVPRPFEDYYLGDTVYLSVDRGRLQLDKQGVRVFRLPITISDNGDERVTSINSIQEG